MAFTLTSSHVGEDLLKARDPQVTGAELVLLAAHRDATVKAAVAARADCPMASMLSLAHESDPRVLESLISNPSVPQRVLEQLSQHRKPRIRSLAAARLAEAPV